LLAGTAAGCINRDADPVLLLKFWSVLLKNRSDYSHINNYIRYWRYGKDWCRFLLLFLHVQNLNFRPWQ